MKRKRLVLSNEKNKLDKKEKKSKKQTSNKQENRQSKRRKLNKSKRKNNSKKTTKLKRKNTSKKRKINQPCSPKKKQKTNDNINPPLVNIVQWDEYVSATEIRNYLVKDPIIDYFERYVSGNKQSPTCSVLPLNEQEGIVNTDVLETVDIPVEKFKDDYTNFYSYLFNKGNNFENYVMDQINKRFPGKVVKICNSEEARNPQHAQTTFNMMKKGVPIIYQGVLHNSENQTYGAPDLIVRSDWLKHLVSLSPISVKDEKDSAPLLGDQQYHYRIVDIKISTLHLRSNGKHLLTRGNVPAYKGQVYIYNKALGQLQGYTPNAAYILGRRWDYYTKGKSYKGDNCFDRLGIVDFETVDSDYALRVDQALTWIRDLRKNGDKWTLYPPSRPELYPNMKNHRDGIWHKTKEELAIKINEITLLWNCGYNNRLSAHQNGIFQWTDSDFTPEIVGFKNYRAQVLKEILDINRPCESETMELVRPKAIINNDCDWQLSPEKAGRIEFFLDFETMNGIMFPLEDIINRQAPTELISLIGIGWIIKGKWNYKSFSIGKATLDEECRILNEFYTFLKEFNPNKKLWTTIYDKISTLLSKNPQNSDFDMILYHWGHAEKTILKHAMKRHPDAQFSQDKFLSSSLFDVLKVFNDEPIVVRGALNFSLKTIARAMQKNGLIKSGWENGLNGLEIMLITRKISDQCSQTGTMMYDMPEFKKIIQYNEIDCKVLYEIIDYLRKNHSDLDDEI